MRGDPVQVVFYNKLSWFVSEILEKDNSNVDVQCIHLSIFAVGLCA